MFHNTKMYLLPKLFHAYVNEKLKDSKLSSMYFPYMIMLLDKKGLTMTEMSNIGHMDKSNTSRVVNELINLKLVKMEFMDTDKRVKMIKLTSEGEKYVNEFIIIRDEWNTILFQGISSEERIIIDKFLDRIVDNASIAINKIKTIKEELDV